MPKRSNEFQQLVFAIQCCGSNETCVTESKMLTDRQTGANTEVDIVVETTANDFNIVISIEVRDRKRPSTVEWVREMLGKHSTLPTNKLVLISKSGFTKEAKEKANENDIDVISFEEAKLFDWSDKTNYLVKKDCLHIASFQLSATEFNISFSDKSAFFMQSENEIIDSDDIFFIPSQNEKASVGKMPESILKNESVAVPIMNKWIKDGEDKFKISWIPTVECYIKNKNDVKLYVNEITLSGISSVKRVPIKLKPGIIQNKQVAHANIPDIFETDEKRTATVSFVESDGNKLDGVIVIPGTKGSQAKVKYFNFNKNLNEKT